VVRLRRVLGDTGQVAQRQQTSLRISVRAFECLSTIAKDRRVSRDQAVRELLQAHVAVQAAGSHEHRLTHISTVLRFPPPPPGRHPDGRVRLAVRLDDGIAARAAAMSLRLPGQAASRGFKDYGARPLTDALVTAIARVLPFVDDGLEGLPPLLTQREALGLWRLTVAATITKAEQRALLGPQSDETADVLRDEDVAWHAPWRFQVARHLAEKLLMGSQTAASRRLLWDQTVKFATLRSDLELTEDFDHPLLTGLCAPDHDLQGRGGAAVWRAKRQLAVESVAQWLTRSGDTETSADPPGWRLAPPKGWRGYQFVRTEQLPPKQQSDLAAGRVLRIDALSRSVLWPYEETGLPIDGFDAVLRGAGDLTPVELVELVLVTAEDLETHPLVPAQTACELGFISPADRDELVAGAADHNQREIADALLRAKRLSEAEREALRAASRDPERFARLARRSHLQCRLTHPTWTWQMESVAEVLASGANPAQLRWLAGAVREIHRHVLERSMERAWHQAFWLGRTVVDDEV